MTNICNRGCLRTVLSLALSHQRPASYAFRATNGTGTSGARTTLFMLASIVAN
jgi:hypothetical protein